jgi:plasmid stabilization system protein ParE
VKVELLPRAESDIVRQFRYYLLDRGAPLVAQRFREALRESLDLLKIHPCMGHLSRGSITGLRSWPIKDFETIHFFYIETPRAVRVIRILHGKRDVRRILKQEKIS